MTNHVGDQETWVKLKTKSCFYKRWAEWWRKMFFLSCYEYGTKKKSWVPMRNWTSDLRIPHCDALPLSQNRSRKSESVRFDCCDITMVIWWLSDLCSDALPLSWNWSTESEGLRFNEVWGPRLVTRRKTSLSISSPSSKLTMSLILFTSWMILAFWLVLTYDLLETDA